MAGAGLAPGCWEDGESEDGMASPAQGVRVRERPGVLCEQGGRSEGRAGGWGAEELAGDAETRAAKVTRWTDVSVEEGGHLIRRCGS